jgi:hypothetical protein
MYCDHHRNFIELQPQGPVPRHSEDAARRAQALHFMTSIYDWLKRHALDDKVSNVDVTAFGQIRITCEAGVISRLRGDGDMHIAAIRPGAIYVEGMGRNGRRG